MSKKVRSIRMEPADNGGWSVDTMHEPDPTPKKGMSMMDYDSDREHTVHSTNEDAMDHIATKMKEHGGKERPMAKGSGELAKTAAKKAVK